MKIALGLPNQMCGTDPAIISSWAAQSEPVCFSALVTVTVFRRLAEPVPGTQLPSRAALKYKRLPYPRL